jgi:hypothetical protein
LGSLERDVAIEEPAPPWTRACTRHTTANHDRYVPSIVGTVVSSDAALSTLRLVLR